MSLDAKVIGARIRQLRLARGLSQAELGKAINTNPGLICRWENGHKLASLRSRKKLAEFFKVEIEYLSGDGNQRLTEVREMALSHSRRKLAGSKVSNADLSLALKTTPSDAEKAIGAREEEIRQLMKGAHERLLRKLSDLRRKLGYDQGLHQKPDGTGSD